MSILFIWSVLSSFFILDRYRRMIRDNLQVKAYDFIQNKIACYPISNRFLVGVLLIARIYQRTDIVQCTTIRRLKLKTHRFTSHTFCFLPESTDLFNIIRPNVICILKFWDIQRSQDGISLDWCVQVYSMQMTFTFPKPFSFKWAFKFDLVLGSKSILCSWNIIIKTCGAKIH